MLYCNKCRQSFCFSNNSSWLTAGCLVVLSTHSCCHDRSYDDGVIKIKSCAVKQCHSVEKPVTAPWVKTALVILLYGDLGKQDNQQSYGKIDPFKLKCYFNFSKIVITCRKRCLSENT